ncbi:DTX44 [Scenedesmus sp. PABB004]|nr:DTX44 [Scenedesmus sp. PABB004]
MALRAGAQAPGAAARSTRGARGRPFAGGAAPRPAAPVRCAGPAAAAAGGAEPGWGEARRDWLDARCDEDAPGPLSELDAEWQAFIAGSGRNQQPQPLLWNADGGAGGAGRQQPGGRDGARNGAGAPRSGNRGPEASTRGDQPQQQQQQQQQQRYSSSIQSFDDWEHEPEAVPVPCNLPAGEAASARGGGLAAPEALAWPGAGGGLLPAGARLDAASPSDLLTGRTLWHSLREVYVLLFGVGQKDTEGIYSLRAVSDEGLPTETIIAFESMEDAVRYAALLEATMEHCPHVCSIPPTELMAFCGDSGYRCRLELAGSLLMPPDYNVHVTDWERSLRLREGKFHVLPEEPERAAGEAAGAAAQLLLRQSELGAAQLATLKAQLEALLPATPTDSRDDAAPASRRRAAAAASAPRGGPERPAAAAAAGAAPPGAAGAAKGPGAMNKLLQNVNLAGTGLFFQILAGNQSLALPHVSVPDITWVDWAALRAAGFKLCVFDKDNTLCAPFELAVPGRLAPAFAACRDAFGGAVCLYSNSAGLAQYDPRGEEAAALEGAFGVAVARHADKKPAGGCAELQAQFGCAPHEMVFVGDRYLTDVVFGNRHGMLTIRVAPLTAAGEPPSVAAARALEDACGPGARLGQQGQQRHSLALAAAVAPPPAGLRRLALVQQRSHASAGDATPAAAPRRREHEQQQQRGRRRVAPRAAAAAAADMGGWPQQGRLRGVGAGAGAALRGLLAPSQYDAELLHLAAPALAAMMLEPLMSVLSAAFLGHLGTQQLGAVSLASLATSLATYVFSFLVFLTTPRIAAAHANGDARTVSRLAAVGLWLAAGTGLCVAVGMNAGAGAIVAALNPPEPEVALFATQYMAVRSWGILAAMLGFVASGTWRGVKDTRTPLRAAVAAALTHLTLTPLFILGLDLGVWGAGLAATISQWVSCAMLLGLMLRRGLLHPGDLAQPPRWGEVAPYLWKGAVLAFRMVVTFGMIMFASAICVRAGAASQAAFEIIRQVWIISIQLFESLNVATQAMAAGFLGRGDRAAARAVLVRAAALAAGAGVAVGGALLLARGRSIMDGGLIAAGQTNALSVIQVAGSLVQYAALAALVSRGAGGVLGVWAVLKVLTVARLAGGAWVHFGSARSAFRDRPRRDGARGISASAGDGAAGSDDACDGGGGAAASGAGSSGSSSSGGSSSGSASSGSASASGGEGDAVPVAVGLDGGGCLAPVTTPPVTTPPAVDTAAAAARAGDKDA